VIPPSDTPPSATDVSAPADEPLDPVVESYRKLADVFHDVLSEQSLDDLLQRIADTVGELIPYDDITFYEANDATQELRAVFASGEDVEKVLADPPFAYGVGITGWAVEHREPVLANRAELDPRVRFVENTTPDPESLIVVPLIARGRLKGTLNIYRSGFQEFTEDEFLLVVRFGDAAALAIDNAHIRASLERQAQSDPLTGLWNHRTFHERLQQDLVTASRDQTSVAVIMLDLDDFKRVNDVYSHATGDQVLSEVAGILLASVRGSDSVCRIGGEEFAIIAPTKALADAFRLAERVQEHVSETGFGPVGPLSLSIGIASGPEHAANPRELVACAEVAMMTAKARGKGQIVVFHDDGPGRPSDDVPGRSAEFRSIAHLKMLHGASAKLSRLNDVTEIGTTIANELRLLIDYHNCRVFVREGDDLHLISFRGDLRADAARPEAALATRVGDGITGHVAATGQPFITGDAAQCDIGRRIPGTEEIEESLLAVPLRYGPTVVGVIVVSKLGLDQFDADDLRLLEVLAGHASVALMNARLYEAQRREAESAKALLELTRELSAVTNLDGVLEQVALGAARIMDSERCSVWLPTPEGGLVCRATAGGGEYAALQGGVIPPEIVAPFASVEEPFVMHEADTRRIGHALRAHGTPPAHAVAVIPLDHGLGALAVAVETDVGARELELLAGIASQARLAITNAGSFASLERTFLSTVEALANALEAKDAYTSSHTRWICDMAIEVGTALGLDSDRLKRVELGALFHDIGKIGIPASILMKAGPLTEEERAVIERHPELGERILAPIEQLAQVRPIVRACHERYDGRGYPDGLRGDEIPLEARIIFACDAFHAMTTDRPYRDALGVHEAFRRLAEAAGTQFDPRVVDICLRVLRQPPPLDSAV
jgi:diguanylate cyclase (GGDEF)-like protein